MSRRPLHRILLVDDALEIRTIASLVLARRGGFTVETAASGAEALEKAEGFSPDLILLDNAMPGMDGPATLEALRKLPALAGTPVVFLTASLEVEERARFASLGALGVIPKPFDPLTLPEQLERLWAREAR
jgi:two-component system OmpR family response regulator